MRRMLLVALLAGCGFKATNGGQSIQTDAPAGTDGRGPGDSGSADGPGDASTPDVMADSSSGPQCPANYLPIVGLSTASPSTYRFVSTQTTWLAAENDCEDDAIGVPTHLVVLDSNAERSAMIAGPLGISTIADQWIGATDLQSEGQLRYVTTQQNTLTLSPTMNADNKDCVRIHNAGANEYRACTETNVYICECDGAAADEDRFPNFPDGNNGGGGGGGGGPGFP
jgi:hypothetical protein